MDRDPDAAEDAREAASPPFRYRYEGSADTESTVPETEYIDTRPLTGAEQDAHATSRSYDPC